MAFSYNEYIGDGSTRTFTFGFTGPDKGYIRNTDIVVLVDGVPDLNFQLTSSNSLELDVAPSTGAVVRIRRVMPKDAPYTDFSRGNKFGEANLNNSFLQTLYTVHEFQDGWFPDGFRFLSSVRFSADIDFEGYDLNNVGTLQVSDVIIGEEGLSLGDSIAEAYNWAQYPVDAPVPEGSGSEYSSYHYSVKSDNSRVLSESAKDAAIVARNAAQAAQGLAEGARDAAQGFAGDAGNSATQAGISAGQASGYADNAQASATAAGISEGNALSSANNSANFADDSSDSATESKNWAETAEDVPVVEGNGTEYSSKHYSKKAQQWATNSNGSALASLGFSEDAQVYAQDALGHSNTALGHAQAAGQSALDAQAAADSIDSTAFMAVSYYNGDLDNLVDAGTYRVHNHPSVPAGGYYGNVLVMRTPGADTAAQMIFDYASGFVAWRGGNPSQTGGAGSWGPWVSLLGGGTELFVEWVGQLSKDGTGIIATNWNNYDWILVNGDYEGDQISGWIHVGTWTGLGLMGERTPTIGIRRTGDNSFVVDGTTYDLTYRTVRRIWGVKA